MNYSENLDLSNDDSLDYASMGIFFNQSNTEKKGDDDIGFTIGDDELLDLMNQHDMENENELKRAASTQEVIVIDDDEEMSPISHERPKKKVRFNMVPEFEPEELKLDPPCMKRDFHDCSDGNFIRIIEHPSRESFESSVAFHFDNPAACFAERGHPNSFIWTFRNLAHPNHNLHGRIGTTGTFVNFQVTFRLHFKYRAINSLLYTYMKLIKMRFSEDFILPNYQILNLFYLYVCIRTCDQYEFTMTIINYTNHSTSYKRNIVCLYTQYKNRQFKQTNRIQLKQRSIKKEGKKSELKASQIQFPPSINMTLSESSRSSSKSKTVSKKKTYSKKDPRYYGPFKTPVKRFSTCTFLPDFPSTPLDDNIPGMYIFRKHDDLHTNDEFEETDDEVAAITSNGKKCVGARRKLTYTEEELQVPETEDLTTGDNSDNEVVPETDEDELFIDVDENIENGCSDIDVEDDKLILKLIDLKSKVTDMYASTKYYKYKKLADAYDMVIHHLNNQFYFYIFSVLKYENKYIISHQYL